MSSRLQRCCYGFVVYIFVWLSLQAQHSVSGMPPEANVVTTTLGETFAHSWNITRFQKLNKLYWFVNKTSVAGHRSEHFPNISCIKNKKHMKMYKFCRSNVEPYSSIEDSKFKLVIKDMPLDFNGSTMYLHLYYGGFGRPEEISEKILVTVKNQPVTVAPTEAPTVAPTSSNLSTNCHCPSTPPNEGNQDMIKSLKDTIKDLNDTIKDLNDTIKNLNDTRKDLNDIIKNLKDTINGLNDTIVGLSIAIAILLLVIFIFIGFKIYHICHSGEEGDEIQEAFCLTNLKPAVNKLKSAYRSASASVRLRK